MSKELEILMNRARLSQMWNDGAYVHVLEAKAGLHMTMERAQFLADLLAEIVQQYDKENQNG